MCGLDVSGNPHSGNLKDYLPVLQEAQRSGLKLAVHLAEVSAALREGSSMDIVRYREFKCAVT